MAAASLTLAERRERQQRHDAERTAHLAEREHLLSPRRDNTELEAIAHEAEARFGPPETTSAEVLAWVAETFGLRTAVACSMADAVLPAVVAEHIDWVDTLFLDTGYHFSETLGTRDAVEASMRLTIVDVLPLQTVAEQDAEHGAELHRREPALCCQMRKVEPSPAPSPATRRGSRACAATRGPPAPTRRGSRGTPRTAWSRSTRSRRGRSTRCSTTPATTTSSSTRS